MPDCLVRRACRYWRKNAASITLPQGSASDLLLALRAVVRASAGDNDALDRRLARKAGLTFASVDTMLQLEEPRLARRVHVIGNRRSSGPDRLLQHIL